MKRLTLIDRSPMMQPAVNRLVEAYRQLGYEVTPDAAERAYSDWSQDSHAAAWFVLPEDPEQLLDLCQTLLNAGLFHVTDAQADQLTKYETAIRDMRDQRGDDRCWKDLENLYALLPEGYTPPVRDEAVEIENCIKYIRSCHDPRTTYVSPQRRIEELEALTQQQTQKLIEMREGLQQTYYVITHILTDAQLDQRTPCGVTIRNYTKTVEKLLDIPPRVYPGDPPNSESAPEFVSQPSTLRAPTIGESA